MLGHKPELRRSLFSVWVTQLIRTGGIAVEINKASLAQLDEGGP